MTERSLSALCPRQTGFCDDQKPRSLRHDRFRIAELQIGPTQKVPWHYHSKIQDTFYVLEGKLRIFLQSPKEEVRLAPGETYTVKPKRAHLVTNAGESSATFLVLQGVGEYDFVPLV